MVPTRIHGYVDYATALLLIASPWLFDFSQSDVATGLVVALGGSALVYSAFTDYEMGVVKRLPMRVHLGLDAASGVLLAVSPWLFDFVGTTWEPHVVLGTFEVLAAALTRRIPSYRESATRA